MLNKIYIHIDAVVALLAINLSGALSYLASFSVALYYLSMLKMKVIDKKHGGSWWQFFRYTFLNIKKHF